MTEPVETIHERGRAALLAGDELHDVPPGPASSRWGLSVILRPDAGAEARVAAVAAGLGELAGDGHWRTGAAGASHLTVRSLEPWRADVSLADAACRRYAAAVAAAAAGCEPLDFTVTGLVLAPRGVLARAEPAHDGGRTVRSRLVEALGPDGAFEGDYRGDQWWMSLLHFAGPVRARADLVRWVEARRRLDLGAVTARAMDLVRYEYDGARTVPVTLATFPLGG